MPIGALNGNIPVANNGFPIGVAYRVMPGGSSEFVVNTVSGGHRVRFGELAGDVLCRVINLSDTPIYFHFSATASHAEFPAGPPDQLLQPFNYVNTVLLADEAFLVATATADGGKCHVEILNVDL